MTAFDHVVLLLSFVFALALTHLLSRVGGLMLARTRVRFSGLHAFMVVNAVVLVLVNWLALWLVHTASVWDLFAIVILFLFALCSYFFCAAAAPEVPFEGAIDLEAFYWENYRLFYGLIALQTIVAMLTSLSAPFRKDWTLFRLDQYRFIAVFHSPDPCGDDREALGAMGQCYCVPGALDLVVDHIQQLAQVSTLAKTHRGCSQGQRIHHPG